MIVIAGFGFVGQAHYDVFKQHNNLIIVDPLHNNTQLNELENVTGVICCVSTPSKGGGACDVSNILDVLSKTPVDAPVLIKSTIDLKGWKKIRREFPDHFITFSPEFLRAVSAVNDLLLTTQFILAGESVIFWRDFYKSRNKKSEFY